MLKLIRIEHNLFTVSGFGIPAHKVPIGTMTDAYTYLKQIGVPSEEINTAFDWLASRPDHNCATFGVTAFGVTHTSKEDLTPILMLVA
jgi:hypothetical protein